jgi:hypothetical protein
MWNAFARQSGFNHCILHNKGTFTSCQWQAIDPTDSSTLHEPACETATQSANFSLPIGKMNGMVFLCNENTKPEITSALDLNGLVCRQPAGPAILHDSAGMSLRPPTAMSANTRPI